MNHYVIVYAMNKTTLILLALTLAGCNCGNREPDDKIMIKANGEYLNTNHYECRFGVLYDAWNGILQVGTSGDPIVCTDVEMHKNEFGEWIEQ
jgi:hypothetical protein